MGATNGRIPDLTLETLSRTFFREATSYGFSHLDFVRYVNMLLDLAMQGEAAATQPQPTAGASPEEAGSTGAVDASELPVHGESCVVRAFEADQDLPLFDQWLADSRGRYFLLSRTTSRHQDLREIVQSDSSVLGIITLPDSTPIGAVAFLDYDPVQGKAELRKLIGAVEQRGKGFAKEASALWIRYGLDALKLKKIYLNTLNTHIYNIRLNEELGFKVEGVLRNEAYIDGTYHDVLRMSLWRD